MQKLSLIFLSLLAVWIMPCGLRADSPHGKEFTINCDVCHSSKGWKLDRSVYSFDHNTTALPLTGQHEFTECRQCHPSLVFSEAKTSCYDCHTDMHYQTVGPDCSRCHTPKSWLVTNITEMHQKTRFLLTGPHYTSDCQGCHKSASLLRFEPLGIECYDCHITDYSTALNPNHVQSKYSTNCLDCHLMTSFSWSGAGFNHAFFPLTQGHANVDCSQCHTNGNYTGLTTDCFQCHEKNYNSTTNPDHRLANTTTSCANCHTTLPGWKPAKYDHSSIWPMTGAHVNAGCDQCHNGSYTRYTARLCNDCHQADFNNTTDPPHAAAQFSTDCQSCHNTSAWKPSTFDHDGKYFPIYSGKHKGTWTSCTECHTNPPAYNTFSCIDCHDHNQADMNNKHSGVNGYAYNSLACYTCHPTGSGEGAFNHNNGGFPLTGAHTTVNCSQCHANGFSGTPTDCAACHISNYNQSTNPNHQAANIPTTCATCHTTNPGWKPATFSIHNNYWPLTGAHASVSSCNQCHNGNYTTTPNTCIGCHQADYNQSNNPPHLSAQFPTDCQTCHTTTTWSPSTFNHDGQYFPVYSGKHNGTWSLCSDCHQNPANYQVFTCISCHDHNQTSMDNKHSDVTGYSYNSAACFQCHPTGNSGGKMIKKKVQKLED